MQRSGLRRQPSALRAAGTRRLVALLAAFPLLVLAGWQLAHAADGLQPPAADTLWPQWKARLSLHSGSTTPLALTPLIDGKLRLGERPLSRFDLSALRSNNLDAPGTATYLGLGFTGSLPRYGLSLTADFGLMAERANLSTFGGRPMLGSQGAEYTLREMRLTPLMQLGVRYTF